MSNNHWCKEHEVEFFKRGKMKGYAHPIEGTEAGEWCNEPEGGGDTMPEHKEVIDKAVKSTTVAVKIDGKSRSIERQVAAKLAFEHATEGDSIDDILQRAETIHRWIAQE